MKRICTLAMLGLTVSAFSQTVLDNFSGGVTAVNHPYTGTAPTGVPNGVDGTWYDITSDAFATAAAATWDSSAGLKITDGGFTNGVYIRYGSVVPSKGLYQVRVKWAVQEDAAQPNGIRAYQMGVQLNGVHRPADVSPSDLPVPTSGIANYSGTLTSGAAENHTATPFIDSTSVFLAQPGDSIVVAFSTEVGPDYDGNTGSWGTGAVFVDDIELVPAAQLVTVSGTPGATGPADFEYLGQAIDSFRVGGVNAGDPLPNVIHVTGSATGGLVQLAAGSPAVYSMKDAAGAEYEDLVIVGHDGTAPARRTVLIGDESGTISDGFDVATNANLLVEDLNFIPQLSHTWTDDMITLDRGTSIGVSSMEFRDCYFGPNDGSNAPADVTGQTAGTVGAGGQINDDAITFFPDAGEEINLTFDGCVLHGADGTSNGDGYVHASNNSVLPNAATVTFKDTISSYNNRLGIQMTSGAGDTVDVSGVILYQNGQAAPASFGNGWFSFNGNAGNMLPLRDSIIANNYDRNISLNGSAVTEFTTITGSIISDTNGGGGANLSAVLSVPGTSTIDITSSTFHNTANGTVVFLGNDPVNMTNVIIAGQGGTENGIEGTAPVTITDSAIVLEGVNALSGGTAPGYTATMVTTSNVIPHTPDFAQTTNPFAADYFDVKNPTYQTAGTAGGELTGGGDYVGGGVPVTLSAFELE